MQAVVLVQQLVFDPLHASYFGKYMQCDEGPPPHPHPVPIGNSALDCAIENPSNFTGWMLLANGQFEPQVELVEDQVRTRARLKILTNYFISPISPTTTAPLSLLS